METFDAALAWLKMTNSMAVLGALGAIAFLGILVLLEKSGPVAKTALFTVVPALIFTPAIFVFDANGGVETACSSLPRHIEASGTRLTSFDESNIEAYCGAPTLRRIVNQTARQPVPAV